jgi:tetratricopeptide (TPR) repeat protein
MKKIVLILFCVAAVTTLTTTATMAEGFANAGDAFNGGVILKNQKKYDDAIVEFERVITLTGASADANAQNMLAKAKQQIVNCRILAANNLFEIGAYDEAVTALETAQNTAAFYSDAASAKIIDAAMPRMVSAQGVSAMQTGNYEEAIMFFDRSLKMDSMQSSVLMAMGVCYMSPRIGNAQEGLNFYKRAMRIASVQNKPLEAAEARKAATSYLLSLGQDAKSAGNYDAAYKNFAMLTKFDPSSAEGYLQMAIAANYGKKYKDAIAAAETGITIEKRMLQTAQLSYQLAYAYELNHASSRAKACEYYQKAVSTTDESIRQNSNNARRRLKCGG